jgi:hypothetical protein
LAGGRRYLAPRYDLPGFRANLTKTEYLNRPMQIIYTSGWHLGHSRQNRRFSSRRDK